MNNSANRTRRAVTVAVAVVGVIAAPHVKATTRVQSPGCPPLPSGTAVTDSTDDCPTRSTSIPPPTRPSTGKSLFVVGHFYLFFHIDCT